VTLTADQQWSRFAEEVRAARRGFFDGEGPVVGSRAPGRLDVLGGIADYSGCTVLEGTIAEATLAAAQRRPDRLLRVCSRHAEAVADLDYSLPLDSFFREGQLLPFAEAAALFAEPDVRWAGYALGCLYVLLASGWLSAEQATGLNLYLWSDVPVGAGVSSSAALEVAVMAALRGLYGIQMDGPEAARLCQIVENRVVGAPCGIMDQVTCSLGAADALLMLRCQPHDMLGTTALPPAWRIVAIDSGVKHSVGGSKYGRARTGAFMGLQALEQATGRSFGGYLCTVSVEDWSRWRELVPEEITGGEFLARFGVVPDPLSRVEPGDTYRPRACAEHPILEQRRVERFLQIMEDARSTPDTTLLEDAGALLLEAHRSYSDRVDLGSEETDLLVALAMEQGPTHGLYGAKITGGGAGGSVAVLCAGEEEVTDAALDSLLAEYRSRIGLVPRLLRGSSPGAEAFGTRDIPLY
jgi:L-arabinokinase